MKSGDWRQQNLTVQARKRDTAGLKAEGQAQSHMLHDLKLQGSVYDNPRPATAITGYAITDIATVEVIAVNHKKR